MYSLRVPVCESLLIKIVILSALVAFPLLVCAGSETSVLGENKTEQKTKTGPTQPASTQATPTQSSPTQKSVAKTESAAPLDTNDRSKLLNKARGKSLGFGDLFQVFWGLLIVLFAIVAMLWVLKRLSNMSTVANRQIRVLGGVSLGTREKLVVVQIGTRQLVLGVTPGSINHLHTLDEPLEIESVTSTMQTTFAQKLQMLIKGKKGE